LVFLPSGDASIGRLTIDSPFVQIVFWFSTQFILALRSFSGQLLPIKCTAPIGEGRMDASLPEELVQFLVSVSVTATALVAIAFLVSAMRRLGWQGPIDPSGLVEQLIGDRAGSHGRRDCPARGRQAAPEQEQSSTRQG
jgi:hypothetical protein